MKKIVITGGAGFIGSWVLRELFLKYEDAEFAIIDNLCCGSSKTIERYIATDRVILYEVDLKNIDKIQHIFKDATDVYHFAANADIAKATANPTVDFYEGTLLTQNVIESARVSNIKNFIYASGSGVYGEKKLLSISEDEPLMEPISPYGASKLGCESILSAYSHMYDIKCTCFRFGNVVGGGQTHGVGFDFVNRLKDDPTQLTILGDGEQSKPYVHVSDVVKAVTTLPFKHTNKFEVYNIAPTDQISVNQIAKEIFHQLKINDDINITYTGGDRGWKGDVPIVVLDAGKARLHGWKEEYSSHEAISKSIKELISGLHAGSSV
ncbi:MAG: NAD-dependent epimerase/dehydratase family protein [Pseudomonadota bacterium]|nr:NAD-dependent epimerase/dehydratase family protein [Pseudomonadota bacterium]